MGYFNSIDVSEWNGDIDWEQAKADGVEYAFIRCGFGRTGIDKYFDINVEGAKNAGIKIGVYFYSYATDWDSAVLEAEHCIELVDKYKDVIDLPIFYDVEEERNVARIQDVCMAFINTLNYYGYNVGVYTMGSWYSSYFKNIDCDFIWLAYWGADDGIPHNKPDYCDVWQYTSHGSVDGIAKAKYFIDEYGNKIWTGGVDCDIVYNEDMRLLINPPEPTPEPTPEPVPTGTVEITLDILSRGSTGGQVNTVKALLNQYGWSDNLPLDGDFDYDTEQAVNALKGKYGLPVDGVVDESVWKLLLL